jgi:hypothetical protein
MTPAQCAVGIVMPTVRDFMKSFSVHFGAQSLSRIFKCPGAPPTDEHAGPLQGVLGGVEISGPGASRAPSS